MQLFWVFRSGFVVLMISMVTAIAIGETVWPCVRLRGGSDATIPVRCLPNRVKSMTFQLNQALRHPSGLDGFQACS
jgi:hypothetical protein